jgi:hypothetical protein
VRVVPSNLHSCHGIIEDFRKEIPTSLTLPFADILFPEERLSCIVGRETMFLLAVDERVAAGACILALSPEPLRSDVVFIHAIKNEEIVINALLDSVVSLLKTRRTPDLGIRIVDGMHLVHLKRTLSELDFDERLRTRMLLKISKQEWSRERAGLESRVTATDSLITWRAIYLSATSQRPFETSRKTARSETPYGTIQKDDLVRLVAHDGTLPVGTIGYTICRNIGYLDRLSVLPRHKARRRVARDLVVGAIKMTSNKKCDYVIIDADHDDSVLMSLLGELRFGALGKVSYFHRVVTSKLSTESKIRINES